MKHTLIPSAIAAWLAAVTVPHLVRKNFRGNVFTGRVTTLHDGEDKSIAYYFLPGILYPSESRIREFMRPGPYDIKMVHYGHRDYQPDLAGRAVAEDIKGSGYETVRIVSVSMGDQCLASLGGHLRGMVGDGRLEIVSIDPLPNADFIAKMYRSLIRASGPLLMTLRNLGGWVLELPFLRRDSCWRSPAEVIEQVLELPTYYRDYTDLPIFDCVKAVIKDGEVFYEPKDADALFESIFSCYEIESGEGCMIYRNVPGRLADIADLDTVTGYYKVFKDIGWEEFQ